MTTTTTFADLYATHYAAAVRVARNQGRCNDAEDCADESAANILDRLNRGHSIDDFRAYWMTAVRNECIRRGKADRREWLTDDVRVLDGPRISNEIELFVNDQIESAAKSLLSDRHRWILQLVDDEGMTPAQIAARTTHSANTISALLCRARKSLAANYDELTEENDR